jgi:PAS domain S-box-containing protein
MNTSGFLDLGLWILLLGGGCWAAAVLLRRRPRRDGPQPVPGNSPPPEARILLRGGKMIRADRQSRGWFTPPGSRLTLESLSLAASPAADLRRLAGREGRAVVRIRERLYDVSSRTVGSNGRAQMELRFRPIPAAPPPAAPIAGAVPDFVPAAFSSLDLGQAAHNILQSLLPLSGADWAMITVWDPLRQLLQPRGTLAAASLDPAVRLPQSGIRLGEGFSGRLAKERRPLTVEGADPEADGGGSGTPRFRSMLGFPLELSGELVGTLAFYSLRPAAFDAEASQRLAPAAALAALSLQNALVHGEELRREAEARALADLSRSVDQLGDPAAFLPELHRLLAPQIDADSIGFLLYDETTQTLEPQRPFSGVPESLLPKLRISVATGSPARLRWQTQEADSADGPDTARLLRELGLGSISRSRTLRNLAVLPLGAAEDSPGWLWIADKRGGAIDAEDIRRWTPFAAQCGRLIRNRNALAAYRRGSRRDEFIRRLATGAAAPPLDDFLARSLAELAQLLSADRAALYLLDESRDEIKLHGESAYGLTEEDRRRFASFSTADPLSRFAATFAGKPVRLNAGSGAEETPRFYLPWTEHFEGGEWIVTPLIVRGRGLGELLVGKGSGGFLSDDADFLAAVGGQLAGTIEREQLFSATDTSLRRRVDQLSSLTRVSRELNTTIDLAYLLQLILDESLRVTGAACGRIALVDPKRTASVLRPLLLLGEALPEGTLSRLEMDVLHSGKPHLIRDITAEPADADHEGILSAILVPVFHEQHAVGLIHLHSAEPGWFDRESLEIVQAYGIQISIAVANAQRHEEQVQTAEALRRRARLLSTIHQTGKISLSHAPLPARLETISQSLHDTLGLTPVLIGSLRRDVLEWHARSGLSDRAWEAVRSVALPRAAIVRWAASRADAEGCIPLPITPGDGDAAKFAAALEIDIPGREILLLPLRTSGGEWIGLLAASSPTSAKPGIDFPFLEIFASQATVAIQTELLQQALTERRPAGAGPERPPAAQSADQQIRLDRLTALIRVIEPLSTKTEPGALLEMFADNLRETFSVDIVLVAEEGPAGPRLRLARGKLPAEAPVEMLLGQHNPILSMFQRGQPILSLAPDGAPAWNNSPLLTALKARSFLCFPIRASSRTEAVTLLISQDGATPFRPGDGELFQLLGGQLAVYLENARLLEDTRRRLHEGDVLLEFSRKVSSLDAPLILQALADETRNAIPEADGVMTALWEADRSALAVQAVSGYANVQQLHRIACAAGEGLPGRTFAAGKPVHWAHVDMAADFNLSSDNLDAYRKGTMGLIPASALGVPLQAGDRRLGVLLLENFTAADAFSRNAEEVALSLANQSALALEKARLFQEMMDRSHQLDERASHLALLNRLTNAAITTSDERSLLQTACRELAAAFDVPQSAAVLIGGRGGEAPVVAEHIYPGRPSAMSLTIPLRGSPVIETILQTRSPMHIEDAPADQRSGSLRTWLEQRRVTSILILPLLISGEAAGLILIESPEAHVFSYADLSLAQTVSAQLGQALENVRLHQNSQTLTSDLEHRVAERTNALEREHRRAETLLRISTELVVSLDLEQVLARALQLVNEAIGADQAAIVLLDPQTQMLVYRASLEKDAPLPRGGRSLPFRAGEGLAGWVIQQRQSVILPDLEKDPRWVHLYPEEPMRYRSALAVPLMVGADALGALLLLAQNPAVFNPEQLRLASAAANQVAAAINNAELYRLIRDQAERLGDLVRSQQVESRKSRAMLEAIADGVMVTDEEQKIVLFNDAAERLLNLKRDQVFGRPAGEFIGLFGKAGSAWLGRLRRWQSNPAAITAGDYLAERITLDSGRVLSVHLAPVASGEDFIGTVAVFRDITQDVEIDRLKSEFVATVSHELRTPLTAIRGYVEILMLDAMGPLNEDQRRFLTIVKDNSDRLELLVSDLLDISRMESGQIRLNLDVVDLPPLLEEIADSLRERSRKERKPLDIVLEIGLDLPSITADRSRVQEILNNLTDNAFRYTPSGGKIRLRAVSQPEGVEIDVTDSGIGIAAAERERIFERFYRGEDPAVMAVPGTGLGLPITRRLVEMHGGSIEVESAGVPGRGSTFRVRLPRDAVQSG